MEGEHGFALYELILALAILALVAGVVFPRVVRSSGPAELRSRTIEIAALLRSDRNAALRQGREVLSRIDLDDGFVSAGSSGWVVPLPSNAKAELVQSDKEATQDGGGIRFLPNGRSSGGVLSLRRPDVAYQISVNWLTSTVDISAAAEPSS